MMTSRTYRILCSVLQRQALQGSMIMRHDAHKFRQPQQFDRKSDSEKRLPAGSHLDSPLLPLDVLHALAHVLHGDGLALVTRGGLGEVGRHSGKLRIGENSVDWAHLSVHHHIFGCLHRAFVEVEGHLAVSLYLKISKCLWERTGNFPEPVRHVPE